MMNKHFTFDPKLDFASERFIDAPTRLVWDTLTKPEHLKEWYMPKAWGRVTRAEMDLRPDRWCAALTIGEPCQVLPVFRGRLRTDAQRGHDERRPNERCPHGQLSSGMRYDAGRALAPRSRCSTPPSTVPRSPRVATPGSPSRARSSRSPRD
jgi:activator of Hsp90 ATPase-like protein